MADRGEYRAIRRVLLDGPDFQRLPERARWVFIALKLNFGPAGLEVWYPAELSARLAAQTGGSVASVNDALALLERDGWIQRDSNVLWIVGQLENDPHIKCADSKHRKMLESHVNGLPRIPIVARFVKAHAEWFTLDGTPNGAPSKALARAIEGPSEGHRSTEDKPENKPEDKPLVSSGDDTTEDEPGEYPAEFESVWAIYPRRFGGNSKQKAVQAWKARARAGVPLSRLHGGVVRYKSFCVAEGKIGTPYVMQASSFFGPAAHYDEPWGSEMEPQCAVDPVTGIPNAIGIAALSGARR